MNRSLQIKIGVYMKKKVIFVYFFVILATVFGLSRANSEQKSTLLTKEHEPG
jgi:hypothetical protein